MRVLFAIPRVLLIAVVSIVVQDSLALDDDAMLVGRSVSELNHYDRFYSTESLGFAFGSSDKSILNLVAYSMKTDEILDAVTLQDADGSLYGPDACKIVGKSIPIGFGKFDDDGEFHAKSAYEFDEGESQFKSVTDLDSLKCKIDCNVARFYGFCQSKLPCNEQDEMWLSEHCVRTYKCPPAVSAPNDKTLVGILDGGRIVASIAVDKDGKFTKAAPRSFSALKEVYFGSGKKPAEVTYQVSYDGVESERCYFRYEFDPRQPDKGLSVLLSLEDSNVDPAVHRPTQEETDHFGRTHALCKKEDCGGAEDWNLNTLYALTDLNRNGQLEYWYFFANGYRFWYRAEENDAEINIWTQIFDF
jgi:hypothetical protein